MSTTTAIETLGNGDVRVTFDGHDGLEPFTITRTFTVIGRYVHEVYPNGSTAQVCDGLAPRGATLLAGDDLEQTIRKTLAAGTVD